MAHGHHSHHHRKHGGHMGKHHAHGGAAGEKHLVASGNPNVIHEAEERKHGGKAKHHGKHHGKHHRATGGKIVGLMTGGGVRPRLDKPGRKRGGRVGSNLNPLSTAHHGGHASAEKPHEQEGGLSD
jgi:hypothetical protein